MSQVDPDLTEYRPPAGMDVGTKRLALFAGGIGALLVAMVGGWSLLGHHQVGIPIIAPPAGPVRVKPVDPGGMQLMGAQTLAATDGSGAQALAPGPEEAAPQALQAEVDAARHADAPPPKPAPVAVARPPAPLPSLPAVPAAVPLPAPTAVGQPADAAGTTATREPDRQPAAPAADTVEVQLAAVDTDAAARAEWARLSHQAPALFAGRTMLVMQATRSGKAFYRLRTRGFADQAEATAFCSRAKAQGLACTLADF